MILTLLPQIFFETPHRACDSLTWNKVLANVVLQSKGKLQSDHSALSSYVEEVSHTFLSVLTRYNVTNLLEPKSPLAVSLPQCLFCLSD
jgi:hypothetical protein